MSGRDYSAALFGGPAAAGGRDYSAHLFDEAPQATPDADQTPIRPQPAPMLAPRYAGAVGPQAMRPAANSLGHPLTGMSDAQIAAKLGLDWHALRRSPLAKVYGSLASHVGTRHNAFAQGLVNTGGAAAQSVAHLARARVPGLPGLQPHDVAYIDALSRINEINDAVQHGADSGLGRAAKTAGTIAATPVLPGAGMAARLGSAAVIAAVQPVGGGQDYAATKTGQLAAAVIAPEVLHQVGRRVGPKIINAVTGTLDPAYAATDAALAGEGIRASAGDVTQNPLTQFAEKALTKVPDALGGMGGWRRAGQQEVEASVARRIAGLQAKFTALGFDGLEAVRAASKGGPKQHAARALLAQVDKLTADDPALAVRLGGNVTQMAATLASDADYAAVRKAAGDAPVALTGAKKAAAEALTELEALPPGSQDTEAVTILRGIVDDSRPKTWQTVQNLRSTLNTRVRKAADEPHKRVLTLVQQALDADQATHAAAPPGKMIPAAPIPERLEWPGLSKPLAPHEIPVEEVRSVHPRTGAPEPFTEEAYAYTNRLPAPSQTSSSLVYLNRAAVLAKAEGRDYATTADLQRAFEQAQWENLPRGEKMRQLGLSAAPTQGPPGASFAPEWRGANEGFRENVAPWREPDVKALFAKKEPDEAFKTLAQMPSAGRLGRYLSMLDAKTKSAFELGLVTDAVEAAQGDRGLSIPALLSEVKKRRKAFGVGTSKDTAGYLNLLSHVRAHSQTAEILANTGQQGFVPQAMLATKAAAGTLATGAAGGLLTAASILGAPRVLRWLYTSPEGKRFLFAASSLPPESRTMATLVDRLVTRATALGLTAVVPNGTGADDPAMETP